MALPVRDRSGRGTGKQQGRKGIETLGHIQEGSRGNPIWKRFRYIGKNLFHIIHIKIEEAELHKRSPLKVNIQKEKSPWVICTLH
ncbi:MAG: hypothetical protein AAE977_06635 [Thermoplasmataceae archaeon]|jgi:hypothetical protein